MVLKLAQATMDSEALRAVVYAGITELTAIKKYYYHSTVGPSYSHFTEEGERVILDYIKIMAPLIHEAEERSLDQRAKEIVMQTLKDKRND